MLGLFNQKQTDKSSYAKQSLLAIIRVRFRAFERKFGRTPKPDEPLFFDELRSQPTKASPDDVRTQLAEGARIARVRLDPILQFLGLDSEKAQHKSRVVKYRLAKRAHHLRAHPSPSIREESGSSLGLKQFLADKELHSRYGITRNELGMLSKVAFLGGAQDERDYLLVLKMIRGRSEAKTPG